MHVNSTNIIIGKTRLHIHEGMKIHGNIMEFNFEDKFGTLLACKVTGHRG